MATHELELTEPVDLCGSDGSSLNPSARGWSRRPLHTANLHGCFGVNKRWDYWAVLAGDLALSAVYSNIDHFGLADVWWVDLVSGETGGKGILTPGDALELPERPGTAPLVVDRDGLDLRMVDDEQGTRLLGHWVEADGRHGRLEVLVELPVGHESLNVVIPWSDTVFNFTSKHQARPAVGHLTVALPPGHESLNVVIPWDDELFNFTSKHQARPATGTMTVGDQRYVIGGANGDAWGVLDVGRGRWPARINWNWGGGAGRCGVHVVGLQFGAKWTAGTGFTENGLIVDGRLHKLGNELAWEYDWDDPMEPWRVTDPGGQLDVVLEPSFDKHSQVDASEDLGSETHQVFGTWSGRMVTDDGLALDVEGLQGFAEEARQRW